MSDAEFVRQINAPGGNVAVVRELYGDIYFGHKDTSLRDALRSPIPPIEAQLRGFVGRSTVRAAFDSFSSSQPCGYFVIEGAAGLGKSALAAKIAVDRSAHAYFFDAHNGRTRISECFAHLCADIILRHDLPYDRLPDRAGLDASLLVAVLGEAIDRQSGSHVVLVIDAVDEAEEPPGEANPALLPTYLPAGAFVVLTRREGRALVRDVPLRTWTLTNTDAEQTADTAEFLRSVVELPASAVAQALAAAAPPVDPTTFVEALAQRSEGNFMYLTYVLDDVKEHRPGTPLDLNTLPHRLVGYYERFWDVIQGVADSGGPADWSTLYRPFLERMLAAAEPVTVDWLSLQIERDQHDLERSVLPRCARVLRQIRNTHDSSGVGARTGWSIIHHSFAEFLATKLNPGAAHMAIANRYMAAGSNGWRTWDRYGLIHIGEHLAAAIANPPANVERRAVIERLVELVTNADFEATFGREVNDPAQMWRLMNLSLLAAIADDTTESVMWIATSARTMVRFRRIHLDPSEPFALALLGNLAAAQSRLTLLITDELDPEWSWAVQLLNAWLAVDAAPQDSRALRDRVKAELADQISPTLSTLLLRVDARVDGTPDPGSIPRGSSGSLPPLPVHVPHQIARDTVARLRGDGFDSSLLDWAGRELIGSSPASHLIGNAGVDFLAVQDAPLLVGLAESAPAIGEPALSEYVKVHRAYGYPQYRNPSLWHVLDAVLRHPDPVWARDHAAEVAAAALDPSEVVVQDGLGLTTLALRARAGMADALPKFNSELFIALAEAGDMIAADKMGQGGASDGWGRRKRRLCVLAEALGRVLGRGEDAHEAIEAAASLPFGFAGYQAPACLALAETVQIVRPSDVARIQAALNAARESAHNVQSSIFCARTTARVNAVALRWWPLVADLQGAVAELVRDSANERFAAVHIVGEQYVGRRTYGLALDQALRNARTLIDLSTAYRLPLPSLRRLNAGRDPSAVLRDGTLINVPDASLPPLLAARLAAQALADGSVTSAVRFALIRSLVPLTITNPTALDTTLSRLLLATLPSEPRTLASLDALAAVDMTPEQSNAQRRPLLPS